MVGIKSWQVGPDTVLDGVSGWMGLCRRHWLCGLCDAKGTVSGPAGLGDENHMLQYIAHQLFGVFNLVQQLRSLNAKTVLDFNLKLEVQAFLFNFKLRSGLVAGISFMLQISCPRRQ
eukprot:947807-Pelagomonas_calceolata.AAC.1